MKTKLTEDEMRELWCDIDNNLEVAQWYGRKISRLILTLSHVGLTHHRGYGYICREVEDRLRVLNIKYNISKRKDPYE